MTVTPLDGIRVLEFCTVAAGPFCGMLLGDMGADVVKIEPPAGDSMRAWPPMTHGYSENFASLNRNKRSLVLDLKSPEGNDAARALLAGADVVIENNRPGVMRRLGLDHDSARELNARIVYCSISAFGQSGPRSGEGGFDLTIQAMSGIMSVTGEPGGEPVKCGVPIADFTTGLYAAFSVVSALHSVTQTGRGQHIDASMFGCTLAVSALQTSEYFGTGADPRKRGSAHPRNAPYEAFATLDGHVAVAAGNDSLFRAACDAIGNARVANDARFATTTRRAANQTALREVFQDYCRTRSTDDVLDTFRRARVPCAPVNTISQALSDPQTEHMGWVAPIALPNGHETRTFGSPLRLDGRATLIRRPPPELGEHTEEILGAIAGRSEHPPVP